LIHEYGHGLVYHVDLYRLEKPREIEGLGLEDMIDSGALVLIEWGERFPELFPTPRTEIHLRALPDDTREIEVRRLV